MGGPRNCAMFNPQSTLLMIGGFGNLRGKIEMWDVEKKSMVSTFDAPDSTSTSWCPDGQRFLTTTTAPRLRVGNGYKVWHYSGALQHEKAFGTGDELWEADWQARPAAPAFTITKQMAPGITPSQPAAAKQAYRPPGARGTQSTFKLHDDEEAPQNKKQPATTENLSKAALKNKKRKEAAKNKTKTESETNGAAAVTQNNQNNLDTNSYQGAKGILSDPEKEKKMRKLNEKIQSIQKIKQAHAEGKPLEKNQID